MKRVFIGSLYAARRNASLARIRSTPPTSRITRPGRTTGLRDLARRRLDVALVDPGLHTDRAVRRLGDRPTELDVRAQRVERYAALTLPLAPAHLSSAEASGNRDAHALGPRLHRTLH